MFLISSTTVGAFCRAELVDYENNYDAENYKQARQGVALRLQDIAWSREQSRDCHRQSFGVATNQETAGAEFSE